MKQVLILIVFSLIAVSFIFSVYAYDEIVMSCEFKDTDNENITEKCELQYTYKDACSVKSLDNAELVFFNECSEIQRYNMDQIKIRSHRRFSSTEVPAVYLYLVDVPSETDRMLMVKDFENKNEWSGGMMYTATDQFFYGHCVFTENFWKF